jgi:hypothetical protein
MNVVTCDHSLSLPQVRSWRLELQMAGHCQQYQHEQDDDHGCTQRGSPSPGLELTDYLTFSVPYRTYVSFALREPRPPAALA